jgi:lipopolysaccharide biosynthesis protein
MPQLWKIKRELDRVLQQVHGWISSIYEPILRLRHQRWFTNQMSIKLGSQKSSTRIAIYLLYQPDGICESTVDTCKYLMSSGFTVLIVSNCKVSEQDTFRLNPWIYGVMERPNFGYDFGGYRDGILWLEREGWQLESLILINDSIWFPACNDESSHWLNSLLTQPADFYGAVELAGRRSEHKPSKAKPPFFGSFFLLFGQKALCHPNFKAFWTQYKMTSNKPATIRRGERTISAVMHAAGLRTFAAYSREMFDKWILASTASELRLIIEDLLTSDSHLIDIKYELLKDFSGEQTWVLKARSLILDITDIQNMFVTAPLACLKQFRLPIVKKAKTLENLQALRHINQAHILGKIQLTTNTSAEVLQTLKRL